MSLIARAVQGVLWAASGKIVKALIGLATLGVVAHAVGPHAYGVFGAAMLVAGVGQLLIGGALTQALIHRPDLTKGHKDATFWLQLGLAAIAAAIIWLGAKAFMRMFGAEADAHVLIALAVLLPLTAANALPMALLQRELRFRELAMTSAAAGAVSSAVGVTSALLGAGVWTLVFMDAASRVVILVMATAFSGWRPGVSGRLRDLRDLGAFNLKTVAVESLGYADRWIPRALTGALLGSHALGLLILAQRALDQLSALTMGPLNSVVMASTARAQGDLALLDRLITGLYRVSSAIVFPVFCGFLVVAPLVLPLALGEAWRPAILPAQILMLIGLRTATGFYNLAILRGMGWAGAPLLLLGAGAALQLLLVPLAAAYGLAAVAAALLARTYLTWPLGCWLVKRATGIGIKAQLAPGLKPLLAAVTMAATVALVLRLAVPLPETGRLAVGVCVGGCVYAVALWLICPALIRSAISTARDVLAKGRERMRRSTSMRTDAPVGGPP